MAKKPSKHAAPVSKRPKGVTGRPPMVIPQSVLDEICDRTANGESLRSTCRDPKIPSRTRIQKELVENTEFARRYARARESMYKGWAEEILEISDDSTTDYITKVGRNGHEYQAVDQEHIQRSRLRVDTRKWLLSKLLPREYGDKVEHQHGGEVAMKHDITSLSEREKMRRFALFMLEDKRAGTTVEGAAKLIPDASPPARQPEEQAGSKPDPDQPADQPA